MRTISTLALAVSALLYATAPARADVNTIINFDNLNPGASHIAVPDPYMGLSWQNFWAEAHAGDHTGIAGYAAGVVSNPNAAYIDGASGPGLIFTPLDGSSGLTFLLKSAYLTSTASNSNGAATPSTVSFVDVFGVDAAGNGDCGNAGQPDCLFAHVAVNDYSPTLVNFGWTVSAVQFSPVSPAGTVPFDLVVDNLSVSTVPEPGAVFLFGTIGMALLPVIRRRFGKV